MRIILAACFVLFGLGSTAQVATAAKALPPQDLGAWDCNGSPPKEVSVAPGDNTFVWHGGCPGAEGFDVVVDPPEGLKVTARDYDAKRKTYVVHIKNESKAARTVKLHIFVGFA